VRVSIKWIAIIVFLLVLTPFINYKKTYPANKIFFIYPLNDIILPIVVALSLSLIVFLHLGILATREIDKYLDKVDIGLIKEYITGCHLASALSIIEILFLILFYIFSEWDILGAVAIALLFTIILIEVLTIMMLWKIRIQTIANQMEKW